MKTATPSTAALCAALLLSSCQWVPGTKDNDLEKGRRAAAAQLRDPGSAQFRNVVAVDHKPGSEMVRAVCGEINGKNAHGAYAGFAAFVANPQNGEVAMDPQAGVGLEEVQTATETCTRAARQAERSGFADVARFECDQAKAVLAAAKEQNDFDRTHYALCSADDG